MEDSGDQYRESWDGKSKRKKRKEKKLEKKRKEKEKRKTRKKGKTMKVKKVAEEWEIWDEEEEAAKSEVEARKLVLEKFHEWIKVFGKKQSERMPMRKLWDHAIEVKEGFVPKKGKVYPLSREEREEVREFVKEQLRKGYIRPLNRHKRHRYSLWGRRIGRRGWSRTTDI